MANICASSSSRIMSVNLPVIVVAGLAALQVCVWAGSAVPAGVRFAVTDKGVLKLANLAKSWAKEDIAFYPLSKQHDFHSKVDAPFLPGNSQVDMTVNRIIIDSANYGLPEINFSPETDSVHMHLGKASARLFAMWNYEADVFGFDMSDNGTMVATLHGGVFDIHLKIGVKYGQVSLSTTGCQATIANMDVKLTGSESWVYNTFSEVISSTIKKEFEEQTCFWVKKNVHQHNDKIVEDIKKVFVKAAPLGEATILFNQSLVEKPKIKETYMEVFLDGSFIAKTGGKTLMGSAISAFPQIPEDFDAPDGGGKMLYAWLSDESINSFLQALLDTRHFSDLVPFVEENDNYLMKCHSKSFRFNSGKIPGELQGDGRAMMTARQFHVTNRGDDTLMTADFDFHLWADPSKFVSCQINMVGTFKAAQGEHYQLYFLPKKYQLTAVGGEYQHQIASLLVYSDDGALLPCLNELLQKRMFIPGMTINPLAVGQNEVFTRKGHLLLTADFDLAEDYYVKHFRPQH